MRYDTATQILTLNFLHFLDEIISATSSDSPSVQNRDAATASRSAGYFVHDSDIGRKNYDKNLFGDLTILNSRKTHLSSLIWLHGIGSTGSAVQNRIGGISRFV